MNRCICVEPRLCLREVCRREGEDSREEIIHFVTYVFCYGETLSTMCVCVCLYVLEGSFLMCGCDESEVKRETNNNGQNNMITDYGEITL